MIGHVQIAIFSHGNMLFVFSLEASQGDASNENHNKCFYIHMREMLLFLLAYKAMVKVVTFKEAM